LSQYLGTRESRAKLVQPGTTWHPRRVEDKGLANVVVKSRHAVAGQDFTQDRIFLERVEGTGAPSTKRTPAKSTSLLSFLGMFMRDDEKVREPEAKPNSAPNQITSRLDALEARLARLEKELGVQS
jgi:hypothetical protein